MSDVVLDDVSKSYGDNVAVHRMSLNIRQGELVTFLGPSGCGKTTTLRMIGGFIDVTAGAIRVDGREVTRLAPAKRNMGFVFQSYALFPHMTVSENVAFGLQMRNIAKPDIARRVAEALQRVRLTHLADRLPKQLSGGQQQRVALARALVIEPTVLLLDEPLSNLDAKLRHEMKTEIRQLQKSLDLTTIFVTHDQDEALSVSDRLVVMSAGHVEQIGSPRDIFERPVSAFVADFMGFSNLIPVTVGPDGGALKNGLPIRIADASGSPGSHTLALRSEHLRLRPEPAEAPDNTAAVAVETLTYRGSFVDYAVRLNDGTRLSVRGDADRLYTPGEMAYVAWKPSAGAILQNSPAATA
jgi:putative spermidine/putrescine transport system ATP-binding protein